MSRKLVNKTILIVAIVLACLYGIIGVPLSKGDLVNNLRRNIHLGLDLKGGTHLVMRVRTEEYLKTIDVVSGLVKAGVFGFLVTLMGCYHGYNSRGGAAGVGQATTHAVVSASILILLFNYVLTEAFFAR